MGVAFSFPILRGPTLRQKKRPSCLRRFVWWFESIRCKEVKQKKEDNRQSISLLLFFEKLSKNN
jgi:hypothetical protein